MSAVGFEKFSHNFKKAFKNAESLAVEMKQGNIEPIHVLYGLISQKGSVGAEIFSALNVRPFDIKINIGKAAMDTQTALGRPTPKLSVETKNIIKKSIKIACLNQHQYVGTEHLLAAIMDLKNENVKNLIIKIGLREDKLMEHIFGVLKSASKLPDLTEKFRVMGQNNHFDKELDSYPLTGQVSKKKAGVLDVFGRDLTDTKIQDSIDPVIGRENEINRIIQILSRRTKNNPILIGEPGVGKTAIVEGLAKKIAQHDVPRVLKNKKIYALDLTAAIAGTIYRGEFENRLKQIIDEAKRRPEVILFIDEIHNLVGAGSASGSIDAANILKPALARGEIHCLGATTFNDYRKSMENDAALTRRFQMVKIEEPSADDAKKILRGVKPYFERFHQIVISDEAIDAAVELSQRYLPDKFLPDKAIDLIDEAAARIKINLKKTDTEEKIERLAKQIKQTEKQKQSAILAEDFPLAIALKEELSELKTAVSAAMAVENQMQNQNTGLIKKEDIISILTDMTGIPIAALTKSEKQKIANLENELAKVVVGQTGAIEKIADYLKRAMAGLTDSQKPLASFIFAGPSGVGKTYAAKVLAKLVFGDEKSLVKIDMSEYGEKFNISKLIGAPAGYVGYKESGQLTEKIKHRPYAVVLFDEMEKANPEIFDLLLQILDDGFLTDASGTKINFRNTVIIMTSNIGSHYFQKKEAIGFGGVDSHAEATAEKVVGEIKKHFKPEFLNRLDQIVYFEPLTTKDLKTIALMALEQLTKKLASGKNRISIKFSPKIAELIVQKCADSSEGARAVVKIIQKIIEIPLAQKILNDEISATKTIRLAVKNGIIEIG